MAPCQPLPCWRTGLRCQDAGGSLLGSRGWAVRMCQPGISLLLRGPGAGERPLGGMDPRGPTVPPPTEQVRQDSPSATRGTLEGQVRQGCAHQL